MLDNIIKKLSIIITLCIILVAILYFTPLYDIVNVEIEKKQILHGIYYQKHINKIVKNKNISVVYTIGGPKFDNFKIYFKNNILSFYIKTSFLYMNQLLSILFLYYMFINRFFCV